MKKLLTILLGFGLLGQQVHAAGVTESVTGETFAGYANTFIGTNTTLMTDLGSLATSTNWSTNEGVNGARVTDTSAGTSTLGTSAGAYVDLGFDANIFDGTGDDLKLFFVGNNGQVFDVTIGGVTKHYELGAGANTTGFFDPAYPKDPIVAMGIDLSTFTGLTAGDSYSQMRLTIGDGYTTTSAVSSFVGTYSVVPVPAAVWLFGSGLVALAGVARKRS